MYTSEADFNKPEIYGGRVRVWATEWDVFHCTPSRGGRGRRSAADIFLNSVVFGFPRVPFSFMSLKLQLASQMDLSKVPYNYDIRPSLPPANAKKS